MDYEPPGQRYGVATLLYHIAVFEADWLYIDILGGTDDEERGIPQCPPEIAHQLPYPILAKDGGYTLVSGETLAIHLRRLSVIRQALIDVLTVMSVEEFRTPRPSGSEQVTPEWVIQHLAQHEAEHRGQIWEARIAAEKAINIS